MPKHGDHLNPREKLFCYEYVISNNLTQSFKKAWPNWADASCRARAPVLIKKPAIAAYVARLIEAVHGSKDEIVEEIKKAKHELDICAYSDLKNIFEPDTEEYKYLDRMGENSRSISQMEITTTEFNGVKTRTMKVKMHPKIEALQWKGKALKMFTEVMDATIITKPEVYVPDNGRNVPVNA